MDDFQYLNAEGKKQKWAQLHGDNYVMDVMDVDKWNGRPETRRQTGWLLYPSGAMRSSGVYKFPPEDKYEAAVLSLRYHKIRLKLAAYEFENLRHEMVLASQPNRFNAWKPFPPTPDEKARVLALHKKALKCKLNLTRAQAKMESYRTPEAALGKGATDERAERCAEDVAKLESLEL